MRSGGGGRLHRLVRARARRFGVGDFQFGIGLGLDVSDQLLSVSLTLDRNLMRGTSISDRSGSLITVDRTQTTSVSRTGLVNRDHRLDINLSHLSGDVSLRLGLDVGDQLLSLSLNDLRLTGLVNGNHRLDINLSHLSGDVSLRLGLDVGDQLLS
ncbi:hypothetical protein MVAC_29218, partial [Mycolicibacterium vaccae ATCC 25954]